MSDVTIFVFGTVVFGIALASTMMLVIPPSEEDIKRREIAEEVGRENPSYVP